MISAEPKAFKVLFEESWKPIKTIAEAFLLYPVKKLGQHSL